MMSKERHLKGEKKVIFFTLFYKPFYRTGVLYIGFKLFDMKTLHRIIITAAAISACGGPYCDGPHPCNGPERPCCNRAR